MFNDKMWTIQRIPAEVIEGSEQDRLLQRFPTPTIFMEKAYVFVSSLTDAAEPLTVEQKFNDEGEPTNTLAEIAGQINAYLDGNDARCVWLSQGLASPLYELLVPTNEEV